MSVEGKISVRPLAELLCQGESSKNIPKSELIENKAPPNVEVVTLALNKRKSRVMTTARKTKIDQGSEVPSPLKKSRTNKNQLLPGQKTIDKFFKSASKSFKIEISKEINYVIKKPQKRNKTPRNCRKKIVYSEETSVSSESKYEVPAMRKIDKKPSCTIDLVSLDSEEVPSLKTTKNLNGNKKKKRSENKNLPQKKGVLTRMRNKNSDIYNVESRNIAHSSLDTQMIETNEFNFQIIAERSHVKHPGSHPERASMLSNECIPASPENDFELSDRTKFSSAMCSTQRNPRKSMRSVRLGTSNHLGNNKPSTEIHVSSLTLQYESKKLVKAINEPTQMDTCSLVSPTPVVENALVLPPFSGSETAPRTAGVYEVQNGKENFVPVTVNTSKSKEKSEEFKFKFIESNLLASEDKTDYIIDISDDDFTQNKMQTTKITRGIYNSRKTRSNTKNTESKTKNPKKPPRPLPPYKIVEGTSFAVDAFCYGNIKGVTHYFLTHFHCDHYLGLTQKFSNIIYMSLITARLIRAFIPIDEQFIEELELNSPVIIDGVEVTAIDANHCPGAIMLIFKTSEGRCILHTGYICKFNNMENFNNSLIDVELDRFERSAMRFELAAVDAQQQRPKIAILPNNLQEFWDPVAKRVVLKPRKTDSNNNNNSSKSASAEAALENNKPPGIALEEPDVFAIDALEDVLELDTEVAEQSWEAELEGMMETVEADNTPSAYETSVKEDVKLAGVRAFTVEPSELEQPIPPIPPSLKPVIRHWLRVRRPQVEMRQCYQLNETKCRIYIRCNGTFHVVKSVIAEKDKIPMKTVIGTAKTQKRKQLKKRKRLAQRAAAKCAF